jgi:hypothetical protein
VLDLHLIYEGNGRFSTATKLDLQIVHERFGQGEVIEAKVSKLRSRKQHGWFFAGLVKAAFDNQSAGPHFTDTERLRKWLLIQAGHCNVQQFEPGAMTAAVARWLRATYDDIDFTHDRQWIYAKTAKSISIYGPTAIGGAEMTEIANKVVEIIMAEIVPGSLRSDWEPFLKEATASEKRRERKANGGSSERVPDNRAGIDQ